MEVIVHREHFLPVLSRTCGVVERRQTLPILGNLLLKADVDQVSVVGTDLEVEVKSWCKANVVAAGETTLPARKLLDIIRNLVEGAEIRIKVSGDRCQLTSGRGRYVLGGLPASDFPVVQGDAGSGVMVSLIESDLKRLLEKTAFAMAQQDVRYYLNGLLFELKDKVIRSVGTDGHRLARYDLASDEVFGDGRSVIVPYKTVTELRRLLGATQRVVSVVIGERVVQFGLGDSVVTSKLVDGQYPDYERVIPLGLNRVAVVEKEALRSSLVRAAVLSNEKYRGVKVSFEPGVLRLQAHNPEQEEAIEELELDFDGEPTTIGFNVAYLGDVISAVDADRIEIRFSDANSSSVWCGVGSEEEVFVVMPMRL